MRGAAATEFVWWRLGDAVVWTGDKAEGELADDNERE